MKKSLLAYLLVLPLVSCSNSKPYSGPKITLPYVEEGGLVVVEPKHMYEVAFEEMCDAVFYIGDDTCSACKQLKPQIKDWCAYYHTNIYEIVFTDIKEEDMHYIIDSTVGYYEWREEQTLPSVYFFMKGSVTFCGDQESTMNYLIKYVTVSE